MSVSQLYYFNLCVLEVSYYLDCFSINIISGCIVLIVVSPYAILEKRRKHGWCGPFEINHTLSIHIQLRRKRGVGVFPQVSLVRIDRTHSH